MFKSFLCGLFAFVCFGGVMNGMCSDMCMPVVDINGKSCCTLTQQAVNQKISDIDKLSKEFLQLIEAENNFFIKSSIKNANNVLRLSHDSINMTATIYDLYKSLEKITNKKGKTEISEYLINKCIEILQ